MTHPVPLPYPLVAFLVVLQVLGIWRAGRAQRGAFGRSIHDIYSPFFAVPMSRVIRRGPYGSAAQRGRVLVEMKGMVGSGVSYLPWDLEAMRSSSSFVGSVHFITMDVS